MIWHIAAPVPRYFW